MVQLVSDNSDLLRVKSLKLQLYGLNDSENAQILSDRTPDELLKVSSDYRYFLDHEVILDAGEQPVLKHFMEGPFALGIYNLGPELSQSFLIFDLNDVSPDETGKEIIEKNVIDLSQRSLAIYPFVEIFRAVIEDEAKRAERLIKASKTTDLRQERAMRDAKTQDLFMQVFHRELHEEKPKPVLTGKEAVSDILASSFDASHAFYNNLWRELTDFFNDSCRYLGEQYALGNTDLKAPELIKAPDDEPAP